MNDHFVPEGIDWSAGFWMAVTNDPFLINFLHRWWAWATALALLLLARALWRRGGQGEAAGLVLVVAGQVALGLATVVTGVSMGIAVSHQVTGAILVPEVGSEAGRERGWQYG